MLRRRELARECPKPSLLSKVRSELVPCLGTRSTLLPPLPTSTGEM